MSYQIKVINGKFKEDSFSDLENVFIDYLNDPSKDGKPLTLFMHGAGVRFKKVNQNIQQNIDPIAFGDDAYPLYWLWYSGIWETIGQNIKALFDVELPNTEAEKPENVEDFVTALIETLRKSKRFKKIFKIVLKHLSKKVSADFAGLESTEEFAADLESTVDIIFNQEINAASLKEEFKYWEERLENLDELSETEMASLTQELKQENLAELPVQDDDSPFESFTLFRPVLTVLNILTKVVNRFVKKTHHGLYETILEEILRAYLNGPLTAWWRTVKKDIDEAFPSNNDARFAGTSFLRLVEKYWDRLVQKCEHPLIITSSSAGTIYACKLIQAMDRLRLNSAIQLDFIFLIPAVSFDLFHQTITNHKSRIKNLRIFAMNDNQERKDKTALIYSNSILYFISGLLEDNVDEPLLGMQRFHLNKRPYQLHKAKNRVLKEVIGYLHSFENGIVWSPSDTPNGLMTHGSKHQTFSADTSTLESINYIVKNGFIIPGQTSHNLLAQAADNGFESTAGSFTFLENAESVFESTEAINPWDLAHETCKDNDNNFDFVEPDITHNYTFRLSSQEAEANSEFESFGQSFSGDSYNPDWPPADKDATNDKIWHLDDDFSQLKSAIKEATSKTSSTLNTVRIAHIDTGYDPNHLSFPEKNIRTDLERNFVKGETSKKAIDPLQSISPAKMPGHGTGTLGILAGKHMKMPQFGFDGPLGFSTKNVEIIPIRIAESVILIKTKAFCDALRHIIDLYDNEKTRIHVVSMSMGGVASRQWTRLVNEAYEKGIFIVTAAGNNYGQLTPRTLIYPARFKRVVAACGATFKKKPYANPFSLGMQGNYGPRKKMKYAMAGYTPNIPWAKAGTRDVVELSGGGTSSATPQIAMAAALYALKYIDMYDKDNDYKIKHGWQRVEAIRYALFETAEDTIDGLSDSEIELYFGNGLLCAKDALDQEPVISLLQETKKDKIFFPFFTVLSGGFESTESAGNGETEMIELEILQLVQQDMMLQSILDNEEKTFEELNEDEQTKFKQRILELPNASNTLKDSIRGLMK